MNRPFYFSGFALATLGYYYSPLASSIMGLHCFVVTALLGSSMEVCSWPSEVCIFTWLSHCMALSFNSFSIQASLVLKTPLIVSYTFSGPWLRNSAPHSPYRGHLMPCLRYLLGRPKISLLIFPALRLNRNICILSLLPRSQSRFRRSPFSTYPWYMAYVVDQHGDWG